jgi:hypothetical protein
MTASVGFLTVLVIASTVVATASPVVLLVLWLRDLRGGQLW